MDARAHFTLLADYSLWADRRLIGGLAPLSDADWHADQGLFFKSIHMTFNHILVVEQLWLGRLKGERWQGKSLNDEQDATRAGLVANGVDATTPGILSTRARISGHSTNSPSSLPIWMCAFDPRILERRSLSKPFMIDSTSTSAAAPIETPTIDTVE